MDALDDEYGVVREFELLAVPFALACSKVVFRNLYALTLHQSCQVVFQQLVVDGLDIVEVVVAIGQFGRVDAVDEVVVGRERHGAQSAGQQLDGESLAEGGLTRTARARDEHQPDGVLLSMEAAVYLFGYLYDLLFLQGFRYLYEFRGVAFLYGTIDVAGIRQSHDDVPARLHGKHLVGLGHVHLLCQAVGVVPVGHTQQHTVMVGLQTKHFQIASRGHQRSVVVVGGVAQRVVVAIDLSAGFEQFYFIGKSAL